jgi:hypothetical protein
VCGGTVLSRAGWCASRAPSIAWQAACQAKAMRPPAALESMIQSHSVWVSSFVRSIWPRESETDGLVGLGRAHCQCMLAASAVHALAVTASVMKRRCVLHMIALSRQCYSASMPGSYSLHGAQNHPCLQIHHRHSCSTSPLRGILQAPTASCMQPLELFWWGSYQLALATLLARRC